MANGCDLGDSRNQREFLEYLDKNNALLVTLAPNCRSFGPLSHLNQVINHTTCVQHYLEDQKHASSCGHVAQVQILLLLLLLRRAAPAVSALEIHGPRFWQILQLATESWISACWGSVDRTTAW